MDERVFNAHEVARICRVSWRTIAKWMHEGRLQGFKDEAGNRFVYRGHLVQFLESHNIDMGEVPE